VGAGRGKVWRGGKDGKINTRNQLL